MVVLEVDIDSFKKLVVQLNDELDITNEKLTEKNKRTNSDDDFF
jgi:hypothetical protein